MRVVKDLFKFTCTSIYMAIRTIEQTFLNFDPLISGHKTSIVLLHNHMYPAPHHLDAPAVAPSFSSTAGKLYVRSIRVWLLRTNFRQMPKLRKANARSKKSSPF